MAEIAIPAIALGAMYILSNQKEKEPKPMENFDNISAPAARNLIMGELKNNGIPTGPPTNFPVQTYADVGKNPATYPSPNAATDRYYRHTMWKRQIFLGCKHGTLFPFSYCL